MRSEAEYVVLVKASESEMQTCTEGVVIAVRVLTSHRCRASRTDSEPSFVLAGGGRVETKKPCKRNPRPVTRQLHTLAPSFLDVLAS